MARITVEDCLRQAKNRFALVILAAQRTRQLLKGAKPLVKTDNREVVTALREIAAGKVKYAHPEYLIAVQEERLAIEDYTEFVGEEEEIE
ncbi:MAG: DNA-directed RNA polymerase subunit omega [Syntrophobacterales bacterium]|jgi:DNA-directed RNA polymerase subunit omega|nr:DNA-directed RNA polymerase subunit omega [Syntrophobacterales bacterium]